MEVYLGSGNESHLDAKSYNSNLNQILISAVFKESWTGRAEI